MCDTIKLFVAVFVATILLAFCLTGTAKAQMSCGTRPAMVDKLEEGYGENLRGLGLAGGTAIFELFVTNDDGEMTWSLLKTTTNGLTCVMAVGDNWQWIDPPKPGEKL